ncbi:hypothetical protein CSB85_4859 [Pseudomonas aeruginosa]|nr:hypothetical protein CSB85_4859 [Pseudomonas aeruginosa]AWE78825.1 hypothetical protein CSC31_5725 [Pseudomonas aeruginosa]
MISKSLLSLLWVALICTQTAGDVISDMLKLFLMKLNRILASDETHPI